jgi:polyphenol oxidase
VLASEGAVAVVHAGWRCLAGGALEEGVRALGALAGKDAEVVAVIGPGAGACCYEVGQEVQAALDSVHCRGRFLDLRAIASEALMRAGVARVEQVELCTICGPGFFSHRREGDGAGRQAGLAWLS